MRHKVLLVDDHALFLDGLKTLLDGVSGVDVVGTAPDGRKAVELARELQPDVVIMDIGIPGLNGIDATRQIKTENPSVRVLALSMHTNEQMIVEMFRAGASGYVAKTSAFREVANALETVFAGTEYISPEIGGSALRSLASGVSAAPLSSFSLLTQREREVLQLVAEGKNTKEIAALLHVTARTVDVHRKNVMDKLGLSGVAELTLYAVRQGLVSLDE